MKLHLALFAPMKISRSARLARLLFGGFGLTPTWAASGAMLEVSTRVEVGAASFLCALLWV